MRREAGAQGAVQQRLKTTFQLAARALLHIAASETYGIGFARRA